MGQIKMWKTKQKKTLLSFLSKHKQFFSRSKTNLPFIRTEEDICIGINVLKRLFIVKHILENVFQFNNSGQTKKTRKKVQMYLQWVFLKMNYWGSIVSTNFSYKDSVGHSSDWFTCMYIFKHIEFRLSRQRICMFIGYLRQKLKALKS